MKSTMFLPLIMLIFSGVAGANTSQGGNENLEEKLFCGNAQEYVETMYKLGNHLGKAVDQHVGQEAKFFCKTRLRVSVSGQIEGYDPVECEDSKVLASVLTIANPLPIENDVCLARTVNKIVWNING